MGWYNVVGPCVVGQLHYARPTEQPIELDDELAAPLVEAGDLAPYRPGESVFDGLKRTVDNLGGDFAEIGQQAATEFSEDVADAPSETPAPRTRRTRRSSED